MNVKQRTAGECAQQLLDALKSGSDERVRRALDGIANLGCAAGVDSRELEFRDLLDGIVEPIAVAIPKFLSTEDSSSKAVAVEMLAHVAVHAG